MTSLRRGYSETVREHAAWQASDKWPAFAKATAGEQDSELASDNYQPKAGIVLA